jgi:integrase/recombinase XerC
MNHINQYELYLSAEKRYSIHTVQAYINDIRQLEGYLDNFYSKNSLQEVTHMELRSWLSSLSEQGIQTGSVRRKISSLNTYFRYLKKRALINHNPLARLVIPKLKKRLPVVVKESELHWDDSDLVNMDYKSRLVEMISQTFYCLGLRRAELINIKIHEVHFNTNQIKVMGKGGKERIIPFGKELSINLKRFILMRNELEIHDNAYLFLLPNGKKLYPKMVYLMIRNWLSSKTSLAKKSPHVLRHSFATHLADHGADLNAIKELMGHANLSATQIYTHNSIEKLRSTYKNAHPRANLKLVN